MALGQDSSILMLVVNGMGSMIDEVTRSLIVYPNPFFQTVLDEVAPSDEELAEFLSVLWYRCVFGEDPDATELHAKCSERLLELEKAFTGGLEASWRLIFKVMQMLSLKVHHDINQLWDADRFVYCWIDQQGLNDCLLRPG